MGIQLDRGEPEVSLLGRIAADFVGHLVSPTRPSLHFVVLIKDRYEGIFGIDGAFDMRMNANYARLVAHFYKNELPKVRYRFTAEHNARKVVLQYMIERVNIDLAPPSGMSKTEFAKKIVDNAYNFPKDGITYSAPKHIGGDKMLDREYNSSSFVAGLLKSVMGYVPSIYTPGYQTPGWEAPVPAYHFAEKILIAGPAGSRHSA